MQEEQQQIGRLLAQFIGPLASRIVSRGQREAASRGDFSNYLADKISNEKERADFLQKLSELLQD